MESLRNEIVKVIPEFALFKDAEMRDKSLKCFESAMIEGGWNCTDLSEIPFTLLLTPCPASFLTHTRAVANTAMSIADTLCKMYPTNPKMHADYDTLLAGALLHDIGKLLEYARDDGAFKKSTIGRELRHPLSGASLVREAGLPLYIQHIVVSHSWEGDKDRHGVEAIIVHHADFVNFEPLH